MAQIVNMTEDERKAYEALQAQKNDLYNHKSFRDLYEHCETVTQIRSYSKTLFSKYIKAATEIWAELHETWSAFYDVPMEVPEGWKKTAEPNIPVRYHNINRAMSFIMEKPKNYEGAIDPPALIWSSILEIKDPYAGLMADDDAKRVYTRLKGYIDLGLYPMVTKPIPEDAVYASMEKYDCVHHSEDIGIIIDVYDDVYQLEEKAEHHIMALILWAPEYTAEFKPTMWGSLSGDLKLVDMCPTPDVWKQTDDTSERNFGIPMYELDPHWLIIQRIQSSNFLQETINTALVNGIFTFDYMMHLTKMIEGVVSRSPEQPILSASAMASPERQKLAEDTIHVLSELSDAEIRAVLDYAKNSNQPKRDKPKAEAKSPIVEPDDFDESREAPVVVEDADDTVGRRLRLYDGYDDTAIPTSIANAIIEGDGDVDASSGSNLW